MTSIAMLIPIALAMGLFGLAAFFWALKGGQFDDCEGAAARILIDDEGDALPQQTLPPEPLSRPEPLP